MNTIPINLTIEPTDISLNIDTDKVVPLSLDTQIVVTAGEHYQGEYTFIPSNEAQVVQISGLVAEQDITIEPIPSNYGLVTWNGSVLTIT